MAVAACAAPPGQTAANRFLHRFNGAFAFVPQNMDSLWLTDVRGIEWPEGYGEHPVDHLELRCGRDHDSWPGYDYLQSFDGVLIEDYGAGGVPMARHEHLGEPSQPIDGHPIWYRVQRTVGEDQIVPATWTTIVDERFVVVTDTEQLMREALSRARGSIVDAMLAAVAVPADAVEVVYHKFRRLRLTEYDTSLVDWTAMLLAATPVRVEWWGPPQPPESRGTELRMHGESHVWRLFPKETLGEAHGNWILGLARTFGLMVWI